MGTGTDVAMNNAQVTLVKGDLRGIAFARTLSTATVRNMKQNPLKRRTKMFTVSSYDAPLLA